MIPVVLFFWFLAQAGWIHPAGLAVPGDESPILVWYGSSQRFGHLGQPQRWVNVLGSVDTALIDTLTYSLNGGPRKGLTLGSDLHRLARPGDFNVELAWDELQAGENTLLLAPPGGAFEERIHLQVIKRRRWPLPYRVDFTRVEQLQDFVQVVDGKWTLTPAGVRTAQPYYDRVLSLGDSSWTNYDANVLLTVHDFTPSSPGPPTYNVTHMGVAFRWRGHHADGRQPSRKWYPLGAQGEFLVREDLDSCRYRILFDGDPEKPHHWSDQRNQLILGDSMRIRAQVQSLPDGRSRYRFKQWMADRPEPEGWDAQGIETDDYPSGALCLVPHNTDVTIHRVDVLPIK